MILGIHHIGFTVDNLDKSIEFYKSLGFELVKIYEKEVSKIKFAYLKIPEAF
ncbi:MAG: hypothetical protein GTN40_00085 [Candidatus Aenigmarchaeota archaeon]|nr:hypothetical protein [Candidatus Aenigmarchaeota archaeon]